MPSNPPAAWDVYAEQLFSLGFGHPVWTPTRERSEEMQIADVGFLRDGEFIRITRTMVPGGAEREEDTLSSNPIAPFDPPQGTIMGPREMISEPLLSSRTIKHSEYSGNLAGVSPGGVPASIIGHITYRCTEEKGALLLLPDCSAQETFLICKGYIVRYMQDNFRNWCLLANEEKQLALKEEEIMFVISVMKTNRWVVASFNNSTRVREGSLSFEFNGLASTGIHGGTRNIQTQGIMYKSGPHRRSHAVPLENAEEANQCIFFHYYKAKRRFPLLGLRFKAGAGPHELPRDPRDPCTSPEVLAENGGSPEPDDCEMVSSGSKPYDPVRAVLDYILAESEVEMAIASDLDLYALFKNSDFPSDVSGELARLKPGVHVNNGVGTLAVDATHSEEEIDESASVKHASQTAPLKGNMKSVINELFHKVISSLKKFDDEYLAFDPSEKLAPQMERLRERFNEHEHIFSQLDADTRRIMSYDKSALGDSIRGNGGDIPMLVEKTEREVGKCKLEAYKARKCYKNLAEDVQGFELKIAQTAKRLEIKSHQITALQPGFLEVASYAANIVQGLLRTLSPMAALNATRSARGQPEIDEDIQRQQVQAELQENARQISALCAAERVPGSPTGAHYQEWWTNTQKDILTMSKHIKAVEKAWDNIVTDMIKLETDLRICSSGEKFLALKFDLTCRKWQNQLSGNSHGLAGSVGNSLVPPV